jgi:hypothetical protein
MEIRIPINGGLFEWLIRWRMFAWLKRLDERASLTGNASVSREGYRWWGQVFVEREGRNMNLDQRIEAAGSEGDGPVAVGRPHQCQLD